MSSVNELRDWLDFLLLIFIAWEGYATLRVERLHLIRYTEFLSERTGWYKRRARLKEVGPITGGNENATPDLGGFLVREKVSREADGERSDIRFTEDDSRAQDPALRDEIEAIES